MEASNLLSECLSKGTKIEMIHYTVRHKLNGRLPTPVEHMRVFVKN